MNCLFWEVDIQTHPLLRVSGLSHNSCLFHPPSPSSMPRAPRKHHLGFLLSNPQTALPPTISSAKKEEGGEGDSELSGFTRAPSQIPSIQLMILPLSWLRVLVDSYISVSHLSLELRRGGPLPHVGCCVLWIWIWISVDLSGPHSLVLLASL